MSAIKSAFQPIGYIMRKSTQVAETAELRALTQQGWRINYESETIGSVYHASSSQAGEGTPHSMAWLVYPTPEHGSEGGPRGFSLESGTRSTRLAGSGAGTWSTKHEVIRLKFAESSPQFRLFQVAKTLVFGAIEKRNQLLQEKKQHTFFALKSAT
jgi:hypothetical protein